ncbi:hypothetical protein K490DRAFT_69378 [Saccharata proteae CBS 121410]|uniref:Uncharacterized protein n=1 Tax=Saccharata proteae CBS 121410 TaxID=1314787 RepID=A0A9P4LWB3_9PEZI|nr:hypothetical protein K490DRAFT_69378 [Saccharata proteae CBS 121410]
MAPTTLLTCPEQWDNFELELACQLDLYDLTEYTVEPYPEEPADPGLIPQISEQQSFSSKEEEATAWELLDLKIRLYSYAWERREAFSEKKRQFVRWLYDSTDEAARYLMLKERTIAGKIEVLKRIFAPTDYLRVQLLREQLARLKGSTNDKPIEEVVQEWVLLHDRFKRAGRFEADLMKDDFVRLVQRYDERLGTIMWCVLHSTSIELDLRAMGGLFRRSMRDRSLASSCSAPAPLGGYIDWPEPTAVTASESSSRTSPKPCGDVTGKSPETQCASRSRCNVINPRKRPEQRSREWQAYFDNYLSYCRQHPKFAKWQSRQGCPDARKIVKQAASTADSIRQIDY